MYMRVKAYYLSNCLLQMDPYCDWIIHVSVLCWIDEITVNQSFMSSCLLIKNKVKPSERWTLYSQLTLPRIQNRKKHIPRSRTFMFKIVEYLI